MVTFPAKDITPLAGTKLYCLVTEAYRCKQLAKGHYAMVPSEDASPRPVNRESDALPIAKLHHLKSIDTHMLNASCF